MNNTCQRTEAAKTYFAYGSGLMAVPYGSLNEISKLRNEFHANEVSMAMTAAWAKRLA